MTRIRWSWWLPVPLICLTAFGYLGITNAVGEFAGATNLGQRLETVAGFAYGVLAVLALVAVLTTHRLALPLTLAWSGALTVCAGLAAAYWGAAGLWGSVAAVLGTALISGLVVWLSKRALLAGAGAPR